jgi:cell wall-associated NlpC family hydrolase
MQWHLHRSEELYLETIAPFVQELSLTSRAERGSPISLNTAEGIQPADFVVFKFGRTFSHGAIVVAWPLVIHSYIPHGVTLADASTDAQLIGREYKVFEVKA